MDWLRLNKVKSKKCFDEMNEKNNFNSNCDESYDEFKRDILNELEIEENVRGENLTLEQFAEIANRM